MKALLIFLLPIAMFSQSKVGWMFINENTIDLDKQMHFTGGAALATASYFVAYGASNENRKTAKIWGIAVPILAGTIKELSDINTTGFNWADLGYTTVGGVVATYTFDFIVHRAKRREQKRNKIIALTNEFYGIDSKKAAN